MTKQRFVLDHLAMEERRITTAAETLSDLEFVQALRDCVACYIHSVDEWEAEYRKYFRLARPHHDVSPDLQQAQHNYTSARQELETLIPRARRLCLKFDLRDPWPGLLRIELGAYAPQVRNATVFGRSERIAVENCLNEMLDRCANWEESPVGPAEPEPPKAERPRSLLGRIKDYFL